MSVEVFEVGGCVRDEIMGRNPHDIDYTVIAPSYDAMRAFILDNGMRIVVETPNFYTIRAVAKQPFRGRQGGLDFVWARREGPYSDGRRPDYVEPGTLFEDLQRRDFSINALAKSSDGELIDPFGGVQDISDGIIRTVGDGADRLWEDPLRALRAVRFSIAFDFDIHWKILDTICNRGFIEKFKSSVAKDRIRVELEKMFKHNTLECLSFFGDDPYYEFAEAIFSRNIWLMPTMKER